MNWHIDKERYLDSVAEVLPGADEIELLHTWGPTLVVAARTDDGRRVVLKASARQNVHAEAAACRLAAAARVPAPHVLAHAEHTGLPGRRWYLMARLDGVPWASLPADPRRDRETLQDLAKYFARLHSQARNGFGPVGAARFPSWTSWLRHSFDVAVDALHGTAGASAVTDLFDAALSATEEATHRRPAALLHGDLGDGEVFVDPVTGRVTGIADWGSALVGDPDYDFARFVAGGPVDDPRPLRLRPALLRRYRALPSTTEPADPNLVRLYDAHNAIRNAEWAAAEGVDWAPSLLREACELLGSVE